MSAREIKTEGGGDLGAIRFHSGVDNNNHDDDHNQDARKERK